MSVNSVNSGSSYVFNIQAQSQMHSERRAEQENNNDVGVAAAASASRPTVNTAGQTIGSIISIQA